MLLRATLKSTSSVGRSVHSSSNIGMEVSWTTPSHVQVHHYARPSVPIGDGRWAKGPMRIKPNSWKREKKLTTKPSQIRKEADVNRESCLFLGFHPDAVTYWRLEWFNPHLYLHLRFHQQQLQKNAKPCVQLAFSLNLFVSYVFGLVMFVQFFGFFCIFYGYLFYSAIICDVETRKLM